MYKIVAGDTLETISRKVYGVETEALNIAKANPGLTDPLVVGSSIIVPVQSGAPKNSPQRAAAVDVDEVAMSIDGKRFRFWDKVSIARSIDAFDTVDFSAPFDADAPGFRDTFRPFSFKPVTITVGGVPLFTGTMVNPAPTLGNDKKTVAVSCYSLPGVLNDCTPPASAFPLEFNDQGLQEIAEALAKPFGLSVVFEADQGAVFERVACESGKTVLAFLSDLAKQRNLIIASTEAGAILFRQSAAAGNPVAVLTQGASPVISVTPSFAPQDYYSHITGVEPAIVGLPGSKYTVKNKHLTTAIRPHTFTAPDTLDADVVKATEAKVGRMFGAAASYALRLDTLRDPSGELWKPNTTIKLTAPGAMIYSPYEFLIKSVEIEHDRASKVAALTLVMPGAYSGKIPEALPWD